MLKVWNSFLLILIFTLGAVDAATLKPVNCHPQLQKHFLKILQIPEARDLIANIQEDGPVNIEVNNSPIGRQFGAYWDTENRVVFVDLSQTEGEIIGSIIFELHNAAANPQILRLQGLASVRRIDKTTYVEAIERIEFNNSLKAAHIAREGVRKGFIPQDAILHTYPNFDEYFYWQQYGGHSGSIASDYEMIVQEGPARS